jgi:hypothetical protein
MKKAMAVVLGLALLCAFGITDLCAEQTAPEAATATQVSTSPASGAAAVNSNQESLDITGTETEDSEDEADLDMDDIDGSLDNEDME